LHYYIFFFDMEHNIFKKDDFNLPIWEFQVAECFSSFAVLDLTILACSLETPQHLDSTLADMMVVLLV
jgi:hypothetical protein